jgi:hypothetical protein
MTEIVFESMPQYFTSAFMLSQAVEGKHNQEVNQRIKNAYAATLLVSWLPDISSAEQQKLLSATLFRLCVGSSWNALQCSQAGMNAAILNCLLLDGQFDISVVGRCTFIALFANSPSY